MTECNSSRLRFSGVDRRQLIADFEGGRLTSDAGVLLLREVDRRIGLLDAIDACIFDSRDPAYITHQQRKMLAQRIFSIALGNEDLHDQNALRTDPALQLAADKAPDGDPLASPSTLCRLENRIDRKVLVKLSALFVERFLVAHPTPPEEIVLDFDATDDPIHGQQEQAFFLGYYRHYRFLPLYVFCGGHLLCSLLRPSNIDAAKYSRAVTKLLVERIRRKWSDVKITIRGDSGFCRWRLMRWCEKHRVDYVSGIGRHQVLERRIAGLMEQAQAAFRQSGEEQRLFGETLYQAGTWDCEWRLIMKAEHLSAGPNRRFIVSSLKGDPQSLYDDIYTQRSDMASRIREQQLMLFADRTSCHDFAANQFRLLLSSFAYVLLHTLRTGHPAGTELETAQVSTLRVKLLKIAARVLVSVRRVVLHQCSPCPMQPLFRHAAASLPAAPG